MKDYQPAVPRVRLGIAALAMTTLTIGSLVVLPSRIEPGSQMYDHVLAVARTRDFVPVTISPACINVVGVREQKTAFEPAHPPAFGG
jgi:hypothetical protein